MSLKKTFCNAAVVLSLWAVTTAESSAVVPFTEDFVSDVADWGDESGSPLTFVASGGSDGGSYASTIFSTSDPNDAGESLVLFRGHDEFGTGGSSGGAFIGNWNTDGIRTVTAQVRHSAPLPINFFVRGSGPFNFPGAVAVDFVPVLPNTWTEVSFDVSPLSPQFVSFEGMTWPAVFNNIGHLQFGFNVPAAVTSGIPVTFDIDKITTAVPEPSTVCLAGLSLFCLGGLSRRRK